MREESFICVEEVVQRTGEGASTYSNSMMCHCHLYLISSNLNERTPFIIPFARRACNLCTIRTHEKVRLLSTLLSLLEKKYSHCCPCDTSSAWAPGHLQSVCLLPWTSLCCSYFCKRRETALPRAFFNHSNCTLW